MNYPCELLNSQRLWSGLNATNSRFDFIPNLGHTALPHGTKEETCLSVPWTKWRGASIKKWNQLQQTPRSIEQQRKSFVENSASRNQQYCSSSSCSCRGWTEGEEKMVATESHLLLSPSTLSETALADFLLCGPKRVDNFFTTSRENERVSEFKPSSSATTYTTGSGAVPSFPWMGANRWRLIHSSHSTSLQ